VTFVSRDYRPGALPGGAGRRGPALKVLDAHPHSTGGLDVCVMKRRAHLRIAMPPGNVVKSACKSARVNEEIAK